MPTMPRLDEMSTAEKLRLMEALWVNLTRDTDVLESPEWHRDVLEDRERRIASVEAPFTDWEKAKVDIRRQVS